MRQFIFYDAGAVEDDVFATSTEAQIERAHGWFSHPQPPPKRRIINTRALDIYASSKPVESQRTKTASIEDKLAAALSTGAEIESKETPRGNIDELSTPPLSPTSCACESEHDNPATTLDTASLPFAKISETSNVLCPAAATCLKIDSNVTACPETTRGIAPTPSFTGDAFGVHPHKLSILQADHSACSTCTTVTIETKHFSDLCQYMLDNNLHAKDVTPIQQLRSFRPSQIGKIVALIQKYAAGDLNNDIYACDSNSGVFHPATLMDLSVYQKMWSEEIVITCRTLCPDHHSCMSIWTFDIPGMVTRDGEGLLTLNTTKKIARERKWAWKRNAENGDTDTMGSRGCKKLKWQ